MGQKFTFHRAIFRNLFVCLNFLHFFASKACANWMVKVAEKGSGYEMRAQKTCVCITS